MQSGLAAPAVFFLYLSSIPAMSKRLHFRIFFPEKKMCWKPSNKLRVSLVGLMAGKELSMA